MAYAIKKNKTKNKFSVKTINPVNYVFFRKKNKKLGRFKLNVYNNANVIHS